MPRLSVTSGRVGEMVADFLTKFYGDEADDTTGIPRQILVPTLPKNAAALAEWLGQRRGARYRCLYRCEAPSGRWPKPCTATRSRPWPDTNSSGPGTCPPAAASRPNCAMRWRCRPPPVRIKCVEVSHIQGANVVASLVVFDHGAACGKDYRRFALRGVGSDTDWIAEVIRRRFHRFELFI